MNYHPSHSLLKAYALGEISAVNGVTLAVHLESCPECQSRIAEIEQSQALALEEIQVNFEESFDSMFANIVEVEVSDVSFSETSDTVLKTDDASIEVNGKTFTLPKGLSRFTDLIGDWKSYGGKVFSSNIEFGEDEKVNLLYIAEGVQVPQHTHKGIESTLVLHGSFSDESGEYRAGDFIVADGDVKHSPQTAVGQDCLCLTVLTEPMVFTQGVARVFNMFGRGMYP